MAVIIDTVYQKVLALANKEQRGYITPQEFNLFADLAQKEIFEQYFYDLSQLARVHGQSEEYTDIASDINEKVSLFEERGTVDVTGAISLTPGTSLYKIGTVTIGNRVVEEVQQDDVARFTQSPLTTPTLNRPVYYQERDKIIISPSVASADFTYLRVPGGMPASKPTWGYVVIKKKAMYNPGSTVDFELHPSEEGELVYKILKLAGVSMRRDDIMRAGQGLEISKVQQEKQ